MERNLFARWAGATAVLGLLGTSPAFGQNSYFGIVGGQASIDISAEEIREGFEVDDGFTATDIHTDGTDTAASLFFGHAFDEFLALEFGLVHFGEAAFTTTIVDAPPPADLLTPFTIDATASADAVYVGALFRVPLSTRVSVFAKGGGFAWRSKFEERIIELDTNRVERTEEGTDWFYGAGIGVMLSRQLGLRAQIERYQNVGAGIGGRDGVNIDLATAGFTFHF